MSINLESILPFFISTSIILLSVCLIPWKFELKYKKAIMLSFSLLFISSAIKLFSLSLTSIILILYYLSILASTVLLLLTIKELNRQANVDRLTGAYSKRAMNYQLEKNIKKAKRDNTSFTILFIDLDEFKSINDKYGHIQADQILSDFCLNLIKAIRTQDLLFRYGGDEFLIIFPEIKKVQSEAIISRLEKEVFILMQEKVHFSIGSATYPEDGNNIESLLNIANQKMFLHKKEKAI